MQQISNLPVFTGTIPNKAIQNDTDFANNVFGFLNYSGNSFVTDFNVIVGQFNTLSDEIQTAAQSASTNAGQAKTARDEAVGALATLTAGAIDNTNKANNKAYSNLKVDELIANIEDSLGTAKVSAATTTIGAVGSGETLHITGTTTITSLGVSQTGVTRNVIFDGALTLTHHATNLILPTGANIITAAGDSAVFVCEHGANGYWRCLSYSRLNGGLITPRTISGVSFNGTSNIEIEDRLGTAKASAATTTIGTAGFGDYFHITGTTTITSFGTATTAGIRRTLIFDGALTLTHHATNLICPGAANIVTVAGMVIEVIAETTTAWRVVSITHPSISSTELSYLDGLTSAIEARLIPVGTVIDFASPTAPAGYLKCNGALVSRSAYSALFSVIGTTFGEGDGNTTFALPDRRGLFPRGWDDGRGIDVVNIASWSYSGTTITINTTGNHGVTVGQKVTISGLVSTTNTPNGNITVVTTATDTSFTFTATATPTGTATVSSGKISRAFGSTQADDFKSHHHAINSTSGSDYTRLAYQNSSGGGSLSSSITFERGGSETRPKNIATYYCIKF